MMEESIQQWRERILHLLLLNNNSNWGGGVEQSLAQVPHRLTDQIMQQSQEEQLKHNIRNRENGYKTSSCKIESNGFSKDRRPTRVTLWQYQRAGASERE